MNFTWLGIAAAVLVLAGFLNGCRRGFIKEAVSVLFVILSMVIVWFVNPYVNRFLTDNTPVYRMVEEGCRSFAQDHLPQGAVTSAEGQTALIEGLALPELLAEGMEVNNTQEIYQALGVNNFFQYIAEYLARTAVNALSLLISYFLASLLLRTVAYALDLFAKLPVIRGVNKAAGGLLGGAKCVFLIWILMVAATFLCNTEIGAEVLKMINNDTILSFLYNKNILIKIFTGISYGI